MSLGCTFIQTDGKWASNFYFIPVVHKSLMVAKAKEELERELEEKEEQKEKYLEEKVLPLQTTGMSLDELRVPMSYHSNEITLFYWNNIAKKCIFFQKKKNASITII